MNKSPGDDRQEFPAVHVDSLPDAAPRHSKEWLEEFELWIENGSIAVDSQADSYYALIGTRFPIGFSRIDWQRVSKHNAIDVISAGERTWNQCRKALRGFESSIRT